MLFRNSRPETYWRKPRLRWEKIVVISFKFKNDNNSKNMHNRVLRHPVFEGVNLLIAGSSKEKVDYSTKLSVQLHMHIPVQWVLTSVAKKNQLWRQKTKNETPISINHLHKFDVNTFCRYRFCFNFSHSLYSSSSTLMMIN